MSSYPGAVQGSLTVAGERVRYVDSTPVGDCVGSPLLLIHGIGGTWATHFAGVFPKLAERRRVIGFDYGDPAADTTQPLTVEKLMAKTTAVLDATTGDKPVDVVGFSLGAMLALRLAVEEAARVRTVTALAGWLRTDAHQRLRDSIWLHLHETGAQELAAFAVLNVYGAPHLARQEPTALKQLLARSRPGPDRLRQLALSQHLDAAGLAARVRVPTLVVGALHDQIAPLHHSHHLASAVPNARLVTVDAGHALLVEHPDQTCRLIEDFTRARRAGAHGSDHTASD